MVRKISFRIAGIEISYYGIAAIIIIAFSSGLRLFFIAHNWPETNSDEGTVGLMALHITHFKDFPLYLYGQGTLGALEAYMGALLFPIFGPTVFTLRLGLLLLFIPFLVSMYLLTSRLYSRGLALLTLLLLSLGNGELLFRSYPALAGHAETPLFGALLLLLATWLAFSSDPAGRFSGRMMGYGLWGYLVGAAFWNDPLTIPFILSSSLFLLLFCQHELRRLPILLSVLLGLLIALFPLIVYTLSVPLDNGTLSFFGYLVNYSHPVASNSIFDHFAASFLVSIPITTGASQLCPMTANNAWPLSPQVLSCTAIHGVWTLVLVLLWLIAVVMAARLLRPLWHAMPLAAAVPEKRHAAIIQGARLMLLSNPLLTFLMFAVSVQSVTGPWSNQRYLIALGVATPAILWPLWLALRTMRFQRWFVTLSVKLLSTILLTCYIATLGIGMVQVSDQFPRAEKDYQWHNSLAPALLHLHVTHFYTDYWTCDITAFLSQEQVTCSVLDEKLQPGVNRYTPYVSIVASDPNVTYVFLTNSPQRKALVKRIAQEGSGSRYHVTRVGDYWIYQSPGD